MITSTASSNSMHLNIKKLCATLGLASLAAMACAQAGGNWAEWMSTEMETRPNVVYAVANNQELKLDLYLPFARTQALPLAVYIHGGGWVTGAKEQGTRGQMALIAGMLPAGSIYDRAGPTAGGARWGTGETPAIKVAAIVNWFGITDVYDVLQGPNAKHYAIEWFGSQPDAQRERLARDISPLSHVRADTPPHGMPIL